MHQTIVLPAFTPDQHAARVDAALREALTACDRAQECAVLWFAEVQRRALYREFGHATLELYATQAHGFSQNCFTQNRYWQFKRLADDLDRLPVLREAVASGELGWTKAQQVARVATPETQHAWVAKTATTGRREPARGGVNRSTIPPRVRAEVLARDRHRCSRPGCRATRFLEVHHVVPRARGGGNRVGNLVTLCSRCHGFVHEGGREGLVSHGIAGASAALEPRGTPKTTSLRDESPSAPTQNR